MAKFDERYDNNSMNETELYFMETKTKLLNYTSMQYPEAIAMEIKLTFPLNMLNPDLAVASFSPTRQIEGGTEDYDWNDIYMEPTEIMELLEIYEKEK